MAQSCLGLERKDLSTSFLPFQAEDREESNYGNPQVAPSVFLIRIIRFQLMQMAVWLAEISQIQFLIREAVILIQFLILTQIRILPDLKTQKREMCLRM